MAAVGGFRGVSASQDARFSNKTKQQMKQMKFPKELDLKVDLKKVNWTVMKEWIAKRVTELLGIEDEVLIGTIHNQLIDEQDVDGKRLHMDLVPFLEKNTSLFMKELWALLSSASSNETGIPQAFLDAKAEELKKNRERQMEMEETLRRKKQEADRERAAAAATTAAADRPTDNGEDSNRNASAAQGTGSNSRQQHVGEGARAREDGYARPRQPQHPPRDRGWAQDRDRDWDRGRGRESDRAYQDRGRDRNDWGRDRGYDDRGYDGRSRDKYSSSERGGDRYAERDRYERERERYGGARGGPPGPRGHGGAARYDARDERGRGGGYRDDRGGRDARRSPARHRDERSPDRPRARSPQQDHKPRSSRAAGDVADRSPVSPSRQPRAYSPKHPNGAQARSSSASPAQEAPLEQPNVGRQQQQQRQHDADDANGVVSLHKTMLDKRGAKRSRSPLEEHDYVDDDTHHQHQQQLKRLEPLNGAGEQGEQKGFQTAASDRDGISVEEVADDSKHKSKPKKEKKKHKREKEKHHKKSRKRNEDKHGGGSGDDDDVSGSDDEQLEVLAAQARQAADLARKASIESV
eukprot:jgi/Chrzof1/8350/Cz03g07060.t1